LDQGGRLTIGYRGAAVSGGGQTAERAQGGRALEDQGIVWKAKANTNPRARCRIGGRRLRRLLCAECGNDREGDGE
jgi:hypothetical protein